MEQSAYLYSLLDNDGVVRRDLPAASPALSLAPPSASAEFNAHEIRGKVGARSWPFRAALRPPKPHLPKLVSSSEGKIKSMLLTIPVGTTEGDFEAIYKKLLETLPKDTRFVCLVNSGSKPIVEDWLKMYDRDKTATVVEAPDYVGFSIWAQDAYAISTSSDQETYFVEPLSFLRYADAVIADYVTHATDIKNFQVPLYFQGGNILIGDDFWLIGIDYPTKTLEYVGDAIFPDDGETPENLVQRLFKDNLDGSRNLIYVGSSIPVPAEDVVLVKEEGQYFVDIVFQGNRDGTAQPLFHIDMFLTLAGKDASGKYQILVGDPSMAPMPQSALATAYSMQSVYDAIASFLKAQGFTVIRNPLPLTFSKQMRNVEELNRPQDKKLSEIYLKLRALGITEVELRSWYFATANNALVEITKSSKRVWLPTYGYEDYKYLQDADKGNQKIWEDLGFEVTMLPNFHRLARGLGAVHCIQKYLERE
ncbi:hypothetical protein QUA70_11720 [Microcoleus sp. LAD1_D5]|uniref:hypothetical protein n=1 Tax=unclassified Microcoleus TaxID=2642155 RepID=UPI002FD40315